MRKQGKIIFHIFFIIAFIDLIATAFKIDILHIIFKPLLMPALITAIFLHTRASSTRNIIISGLFFAFAGDVFLLFDHQYPIFFIAGLLCFMAAHLFYLGYFLKLPKTHKSLLLQKPWSGIAVIVYTSCLLYFLIPSFGNLTIPVIAYAIVLSLMLMGSIHITNSVNSNSRFFFVAGAVCFVISDSLLAVNKFYKLLPYANILIMLTYIAAQFLIVKACIKNSA